MDTLRYMLYGPMVVMAYLSGKQVLRREPKMIGPVLAAIFCLIAIPSLLQLVYPSLYNALAVQPPAIINGHEYWRLLTAIAVQNGGVIGTAFNLISLFFVLQSAESVWGARHSAVIFLVAAIALNMLATVFGAETAGNSGATFVLAASVAGCSLAFEPSLKKNWSAIICVLIGGILLTLQDIHAYAILSGVLIGYVLQRFQPLPSLDTGGQSRVH